MRNIVVLAFLSRLVAAQKTTAVCLPGFEWMFNALQQSPCVVASYLADACIAGTFTLSALDAGEHYATPSLEGTDVSVRFRPTVCACSTVTYSVMNGCGACQADSIPPHAWSEWIINCTKSGTDVTVGSFPHSFSDETQIPAWAYVDVIPSDSFQVEDAQALASQAAQSSMSTSSTTTSTTTSTAGSGSPTSAPSPTTTSSQKSADPGLPASPSATTADRNSAKLAAEIAVPIVVALVLAALAGVLVLKRRRQRQRRDAVMMDESESIPYTFVVNRGDSSVPETSQRPSPQQQSKQRLLMAADHVSEVGTSSGSATADSQAELAALNSAMTRAGLSVHTLLASLPRGDAAVERPPRYDE